MCWDIHIPGLHILPNGVLAPPVTYCDFPEGGPLQDRVRRLVETSADSQVSRQFSNHTINLVSNGKSPVTL
jgi:hypothetical protein